MKQLYITKIKVFASLCLFSLLSFGTVAFGNVKLTTNQSVDYTGFVTHDELPDTVTVEPAAVAQEMTPDEIAAMEAGKTRDDGEKMNPGAIIIGHVTDAHSWHLFDYKDKDSVEHAVAISLPVILINGGHLDIFMSKRFEHGHADYKGYRLIGGGLSKEEIICVDPNTGMPLLDPAKTQGVSQAAINANPEQYYKKPIDLSITKTAAAIIIAVALLIILVMSAVKQYKKRGVAGPKGLQGVIEILVLHVRNDIVQPMLGNKTDKYLPYLLTLFFFIIFCNVLGLIPIFPAGANITGNIAVTAILALITFLITNLSGKKPYWKDIFNTPGVPAWLKVFPLMPLVELVGVFTKPIVLMIRLFANMTAGHIVILGFITIIFIISETFNAVIGGCVAPVSVLFSVFINLLECLVAYLQAFVFTMLSALYIGMAVEDPEEQAA
jgi:F-type H+-transporting ATPase subunit a